MKKIWKSVVNDFWIIVLDVIAVNASYALALLIRFYVGGEMRPVAQELYLPAFYRFTPFYTVLCILIFVVFHLYGGMWRYSGINDMNRILGAWLCTMAIQIVGTCFFVQRMPITYYAIGGVLQLIFIIFIRFGHKVALIEKKIINRGTNFVPAMIIGAGETAKRAIRYLDDTPFRAVVVVDEKRAGRMLDGIVIKSDFLSSLPDVRVVFIADHGLSTEKRKEIKEICEKKGIELQDFTGYLSNLGGRIPVSEVLELIKGEVVLIKDGKQTEYPSSKEAIASLKDRYEIKSISEAKIELARPSSAAYVGYEAWAKQYKERTGEDVSFF